MGNKLQTNYPQNYFRLFLREISHILRMKTSYRGFSRDVTAAMLEGKNNETAAMLEGKTNPVGVELFSYVKTFFCYNKFAWLLVA